MKFRMRLAGAFRANVICPVLDQLAGLGSRRLFGVPRSRLLQSVLVDLFRHDLKAPSLVRGQIGLGQLLNVGRRDLGNLGQARAFCR